MADFRIQELLFKAALPAATIMKSATQGPINDDPGNYPGGRDIRQSQRGGSESFTATEKRESSLSNDFGKLIIVDYDWVKNPLDDYPLFSTYQYLELQTVPLEVSYEPTPQWATIASIGRNAPFFNYTGSEDTLSFTVDWYALDENLHSVIYNCKWIEALTKSNGYISSPHRVKLIWGSASGLFTKYLWLVHKASYKLSHFQKDKRMLPHQAVQEIVLKKVLQDNSTIQDVFEGFRPSKPIYQAYDLRQQ